MESSDRPLEHPLGRARARILFLHTHDLDAMVAFYRDTLGLRITAESEGEFAFLALPDGFQIALYPGRRVPREDDPHWFLMIDVDDLDRVVGWLAEAGVAIGPVEDVPFGRAAQLVDPEGNRIELHEPSREAAG
ncbi:MAG: VOC family protein [Candidatus Eisenbacteria bacterium]